MLRLHATSLPGRSRVRRLAAFVAATIAALALSACGGPSSRAPAFPTPTPPGTPVAAVTVQHGTPIIVGVSVALSGDQVNLGKDIADAAELAVADFGGSLNGHPVQILREDDGCTDPLKAVSVAHNLIGQTGLLGVIGPMCTTGAQAADSIYEAAWVVHISPSATRVELSQQGEHFFFRTAWRDDLQAKTQADYARNSLNAASAVVIDDAEPYGNGLADAFVSEFQAKAGRVASRDRIQRGHVDFASLASRIKNLNSDVVVFEGLNPEAALIIKELRKQQYSGAFIAPDGVFSVRDFLQAAASATEGSIVSAGPVPDDALIARFHARFQRDPGTAFVLEAHDAVTALLKAADVAATARSDGSLFIDRKRLAQVLRSQTFNGLTGTIAFDERGDRAGDTPAQLGFRLYRVTNGRFEPIE